MRMSLFSFTLGYLHNGINGCQALSPLLPVANGPLYPRMDLS